MLTLDIWSWDPGEPRTSAEEACRAMRDHAVASLESGADVVLFPEFCWMGLAPMLRQSHSGAVDDVARVGQWFWQKGWPSLVEDPALSRGLVVFGTCPCEIQNGTGDTEWRNRAPLLLEGTPTHQDKLHLTPWEAHPQEPHAIRLSPGDSLQLLSFQGLTLAVLICLDIEIPEISAALRGSGVDLILVPSATETCLGAERVNRCASARAIELGCHVALAPLTGRADTDLIDVNLGWNALYSPSQAAFLEVVREDRDSSLIESGSHRRRYQIDRERLQEMRRNRLETNPSSMTQVIPPDIEWMGGFPFRRP